MAESSETSSKDSTKPTNIVLAATSSSGTSENQKNVVHNSILNGVTMHHASVAAANTDEEPDEIRIVEDRS